MKSRRLIILSLSLFAGLGLVLYFAWPRNHLEVQVHETKVSPDGRWTAVVQMEVYNSGSVVNDAVYAVRLIGQVQRDRQGDLVMNTPVNHSGPAPSIDWSDGNLVVTLADNEKYQYLANAVDGFPIVVQQKRP